MAMEDARLYSNEELAKLCPGLMLFPNFITEEEEREIAQEIDSKQWDDRLSRRVQHYGFEFDYATRMAISNGLTNSTAFPDKCTSLLEKLPEQFSRIGFNQLTVNEYLPGQGIAPHVDSHSCFGDVMLSISLLANICIRFVPKSKLVGLGARERVNLWLPRRSLLVMQGPSRLAYTHCVPARMSDSLEGNVILRTERRISLTFRTIRIPNGCACDFPDACEAQELRLQQTRIPPRS